MLHFIFSLGIIFNQKDDIVRYFFLHRKKKKFYWTVLKLYNLSYLQSNFFYSEEKNKTFINYYIYLWIPKVKKKKNPLNWRHWDNRLFKQNVYYIVTYVYYSLSRANFFWANWQKIKKEVAVCSHLLYLIKKRPNLIRCLIRIINYKSPCKFSYKNYTL